MRQHLLLSLKVRNSEESHLTCSNCQKDMLSFIDIKIYTQFCYLLESKSDNY